jgi:ATP synthase proteolipid subunit
MNTKKDLSSHASIKRWEHIAIHWVYERNSIRSDTQNIEVTFSPPPLISIESILLLIIMTVDPTLLSGLGAALSIFLAAIGSATASAEAGIFAIRSSKASSPVRAFAPIVISGVLAIYGIIVSVLISAKLRSSATGELTAADGYRYLCAGLSVGLACAAAGSGLATFIRKSNEGSFCRPPSSAIAAVSPQAEPLLGGTRAGDASSAIVFGPPEFDFRYFCVLVFHEAIGLYGLIVALALICM